MPIMYCNFTKSHAFPLVSRVSRRRKCYKSSEIFHTKSFAYAFRQETLLHIHGAKPRNFSNGFHQKTLETSNGVKPRNFSNGFHQETLETSNGVKPMNFSKGFHQKTLETSHGVKPRNGSNGFHQKTLENIHKMRPRSFSNGSHQETQENSSGVRAGQTLPWIASYKKREIKHLEKETSTKTSRSSWEESANSYFSKSNKKPLMENREARIGTVDDIERGRSGSVENCESERVVEEDAELAADPRWDKIKSKYKRVIDRETKAHKPEVFRWNKQENWGRKTWKEATESTVPKMVGEGVYGVGPILAALTAGRREFYTLYVQEGLDLSGNNRKKKDKKGVEKVMKIAEKIGLTVKETTKHDLNMIVDNRPHQGLVLDASSLEMVSVRQLEPVSVEGDYKGPLWVALDEVTDPQNLGAIIRSAYFFGAEGVVVCAKNSAPLSGVVSKASAGSLELIELRFCKNMMQFLTSSVENGWRVLGGSVAKRALPLNEVVAGVPTILVLGSEGSGLRPLVERSCTHLIRIPGSAPLGGFMGENEDEEIEEEDQRCPPGDFRSFIAVESLNVSVAAGSSIYLLCRGGMAHYRGTCVFLRS